MVSIIWKKMENDNLSGYTIIIPSVAVGNVAQLACDLLISTMKMKKIASLYSQALIPVIGYDPYDLNSESLTTSCEMYKSETMKLAVLQFRAPVIHKYAAKFLGEIVLKLKEANINDIIILTSSFAHENKHILTTPFRYVAKQSSLYWDTITRLDWYCHESDESRTKIYGGGFASMLYNICCENSVPCLILFKYCSEGDNIPDAYEIVKYLNNILPLFSDERNIESQLVQPASWTLLFGKPPPIDIY